MLQECVRLGETVRELVCFLWLCWSSRSFGFKHTDWHFPSNTISTNLPYQQFTPEVELRVCAQIAVGMLAMFTNE